VYINVHVANKGYSDRGSQRKSAGRPDGPVGIQRSRNVCTGYTSHGAEGTVMGSDHKHIELTDIYQLLSAKDFPAMRGKPKFFITQACAGSKSLLYGSNN
jgi:hypothetical protein